MLCYLLAGDHFECVFFLMMSVFYSVYTSIEIISKMTPYHFIHNSKTNGIT